MARAYARWHRVGRLDNPAGWVYRVALNWAVSWWRKVRRERPPATDDQQIAVDEPDPAGLAARAALEALPLGQRTVVVCRVMLQFSTAETAALLGIEEGTVRSRLTRALAALRVALAEEEDR